VTPLQLDVTDDSSVDEAAKTVEETYGRLDILVNNAGIFSQNPVAREAFREVLAVNCVGAVSVTEAFLPLLRKSESPRLIFVSSSVGSISQAADPESKYYRPTANEYRASMYHISLFLYRLTTPGACPMTLALTPWQHHTLTCSQVKQL
jgi:NAD(P)-dependent dehydrogenase (short-subunit alcohol dehydrogenase family)